MSFAGFVPGGGRTVTIQTADGLAVTLLHLGSLGVARGATVAEGASVGTLAAGGDADHPVPYVQMGIRIAADPQGYLDPLLFLPARVPPETPAAPGAEPAIDPVEDPPADPQVSVPEAGAAPPGPSPGAGNQTPTATGGVAVPAEAGGATVEAPARVVEPVVSPDPNGSVSAPASAPAPAAPDREPEASAEPAAGVEYTPPAGGAPAEPGVAPPDTAIVAARAALREPQGFPAWIAGVIAALALITAAASFGWRRWRSAPVPARIPPRCQPRHTDADTTPVPPEPPRRILAGPGGPERRLARSGPHADSPVAALLRRARRARRKARRAA